MHNGSILQHGGCRSPATCVEEATCVADIGNRSDGLALVADVDFGKEMVMLYTERLASDRCIEALSRVVCAYHFPLCTNDVKEHGKICRYLSVSNAAFPAFFFLGRQTHGKLSDREQ